MSGRILVADDDRDIAGFVQLNLDLEGYDVQVVHDGQAALDAVLADPPDLVLLDVMMPVLDGVEVLRRLRANPATAALPVVLLTAKSLSADKVVGLTAGADDYIVKPFDTLELIARVRTTLRRTAEARSASPLTGLPGNHRIDSEITARAAAGAPYAVCHVDLDEFKSFNDAYGFLRGDRLLLALASCLLDTVAQAGEPRPFLGHVGGDDFVVVCTPEQAEPLGQRLIAGFAREVRNHYDQADLERGWLEVVDRRMELRRHPVVTVSIGVACGTGEGRDHREVVAAAAEMKSWAKTQPGSLVAVDRRG
ncbi:MAG: Diguanylate cyclase response regulator [Frankiales bacterium]|jgi:diguanylate cyclase (GGDEF)-like protein|nr:Diguanylate cyclase response regulator [Frankiales bacterium]